MCDWVSADWTTWGFLNYAISTVNDIPHSQVVEPAVDEPESQLELLPCACRGGEDEVESDTSGGVLAGDGGDVVLVAALGLELDLTDRVDDLGLCGLG